ncbi:MAG: DNA alkylation response protein, partial [Chloroflexi bacterium]
MTYLFAQTEFGVLCPVNMTDSLARVLRRFAAPGLLARYLPRLTATDLGDLWQGAMFLTERGGGSDVGATDTVACPVPAGEALPDGLDAGAPLWRLTGAKWFCSNAGAELTLVLARPLGAPPGTRGLGLFLVPRHLPDGRLNGCRVERLKDKLGTRDMATGEVTLDGALAHQVGDLDRGFVQMAVMINASRLSNAVRSAGM